MRDISYSATNGTFNLGLGEGTKSSREYGVHSLMHLVETQVVAPMSNAVDPDLGSLQAFFRWRTNGPGTCDLAHVLKAIRDHEEHMEWVFFRDADEAIQTVGRDRTLMKYVDGRMRTFHRDEF